MDPNGVTPLAGVVQLTTDVPARTTLSISNGTDSWIKEFGEYQTSHYLPVLGLRSSSSYTIEVTVTDETGEGVALPGFLQADTGPLPDDFPSIQVIHNEPSRMEPGYTLVDKIRRFLPRTPPDETPGSRLPRYIFILDEMGEVIWYSTMSGDRPARQLINGNLLVSSNSNFPLEVDLLGNVQQNVHLDFGELHHELALTTHGTILSLIHETVTINGYPTSKTDPNAPTQIAAIDDNPVVEFSSEGNLLNKWMLTDILEPTRIGNSSLIENIDGLDWAHANAVFHDPRDDSIIASVANQDAVIKFSRTTGSLKWILGNHNNWPPELQPFLLTPVGEPFEWQYHQHAPMVTPTGTLLLFDNGSSRTSPFDGRAPLPIRERYSRAVEYAIDEENMEVRQLWEYGAQVEQRYYASSVGDADWLETTGNVLITYGNMVHVGGLTSEELNMGAAHSRIVEVDRNTPAEKVFEVAVYNSTPGARVSIYRSDRIPDLYPVDKDGDGIPDYNDNCILKANGSLLQDAGYNVQLDSDGDGYGNVCDPDLNNDGQVNSLDLGIMRRLFYTNNTQAEFDQDADLNGDGYVNSLDLGIVKSLFSQPPGPSALAP
jgi:arylsulfate sulfotransferase